jgi:hypothetical protein
VTGDPHPAATRPKTAFYLLLFALACAVQAALDCTALRHPPLHAEDGSVLLERFYVAGSFGRVVESYNGYLSILPNLCAWVVCRLPATAIPLGMALAALCLHAASICCLVATALQGSPRASIAFVSAALSGLAIGNYAISCSLMYSQVSLLLILSSVLWKTQQVRTGLACALLAHACLWSHPLGPVVVGLVAARWALSGATINRIWWASLIASAVAYWCCATQGLRTAPETGPLDWLSYFGVRGILELVIPTSLKSLWYRPLPVVWSAVAALVLAAWIAWIRAQHRSTAPAVNRGLSGSGIDLLVALALPIISMVARPGLLSPADEWGQRYVFFSRCLVILAVWSWATRPAGHGWTARGRVRWAMAIVYVAAMWHANRPYYAPDVAASTRVAQFMQTLSDLEATSAEGRSGVRAFLERGDWDISIGAR